MYSCIARSKLKVVPASCRSCLRAPHPSSSTAGRDLHHRFVSIVSLPYGAAWLQLPLQPWQPSPASTQPQPPLLGQACVAQSCTSSAAAAATASGIGYTFPALQCGLGSLDPQQGSTMSQNGWALGLLPVCNKQLYM